MGPLYPSEKENEINDHSKVKASNAPNLFQWNLLHGLHEIIGDDLKVINVLPVGSWYGEYNQLYLHDDDWISGGISGHEIGCINLPFVKQLMRSQKAKKMLKRRADENTEIIIYSAYMPFLRAVYHLPKSIKVTAIITDLPEYYDLGNTSKLKKMLRKYQNHMVYKYLNRVDRFVILTDQMYGSLRIGNRPYVRIEGIYNHPKEDFVSTDSGKRIIMYSGTLHYQYGIKNLLLAFECIDDEDLELWICGSGEAENEIIELAKQDTRIKYYGFCLMDKVSELRSQASILVNPRMNEGEYTKYSFPSKTMEYLASGKPVVMYKLDGIPDEYDDYLNYVDVFEEHVIGLKKEILSVLDNYDMALKKACLAQRFVFQEKNSNVQAKKIMDMIFST